jgi:hypothetical protein
MGPRMLGRVPREGADRHHQCQRCQCREVVRQERGHAPVEALSSDFGTLTLGERDQLIEKVTVPDDAEILTARRFNGAPRVLRGGAGPVTALRRTACRYGRTVAHVPKWTPVSEWGCGSGLMPPHLLRRGLVGARPLLPISIRAARLRHDRARSAYGADWLRGRDGRANARHLAKVTDTDQDRGYPHDRSSPDHLRGQRPA